MEKIFRGADMDQAQLIWKQAKAVYSLVEIAPEMNMALQAIREQPESEWKGTQQVDRIKQICSLDSERHHRGIIRSSDERRILSGCRRNDTDGSVWRRPLC